LGSGRRDQAPQPGPPLPPPPSPRPWGRLAARLGHAGRVGRQPAL